MQSLHRYLLDRMVLRPTRDPIDPGPQRREMLGSPGRTLECFVQENFAGDQSPDLLVLKFPGTGGRGERSSTFPMSMIPEVRSRIWTWNPPGYGRSPGQASLSRIAETSLDFYEQVLQRESAPATVWLCGNSLGCSTVLHIASTITSGPVPPGLLLRNPVPLVPVVKRIARRYPLGRFVDSIAESVCDEMNAMMTAKQVNLPAVFLQSQCDTLVPPPLQNKLIEIYAGEHRLVPLEGLEHDGVPSDEHDVAIEASVRWMWQRTQLKS